MDRARGSRVPSESSWPNGQCPRVPTATRQVTVSAVGHGVGPGPCSGSARFPRWGGVGHGHSPQGNGTVPGDLTWGNPPWAGSRAWCPGWGLTGARGLQDLVALVAAIWDSQRRGLLGGFPPGLERVWGGSGAPVFGLDVVVRWAGAKVGDG